MGRKPVVRGGSGLRGTGVSSGAPIPNRGHNSVKDLSSELIRVAFEDLQKINVKIEYDMIRESLSLGEKASRPAEILTALDRSSELANTAAKLCAVTSYNVGLELLEIEAKKVEIEAQVSEFLHERKKSGEESGQISEAKIRRYCLTNDPYKKMYMQHEEREHQLKAVEKIMKALAQQSNDHKNVLQTQANLSDKIIGWNMGRKD